MERQWNRSMPTKGDVLKHMGVAFLDDSEVTKPWKIGEKKSSDESRIWESNSLSKRMMKVLMILHLRKSERNKNDKSYRILN